MIRKILQGASAVTLIVATTVIAQSPRIGPTQSDANKQVCRSLPDTGSRLGRSRACHTAQEWEDLRRQTKQNVDHIQNARPMNGCPPAC